MAKEKYAKEKRYFVRDYLNHDLTIQQIADKYGCSWWIVWDQLKKQNARKPWSWTKIRQKTMTGYICTKCKRDLPDEMFARKTDGLCNRASHCRDCHSEYDRVYRAKKNRKPFWT